MTAAHFERLYTADRDPFRVGTAWYERRKIEVAAAALAAPRYRHVWDAACGTGHLAARLAPRSTLLTATDSSTTACAISRELLGTDPGVRVAVHSLPARPEFAEPVDLLVLSEVLYYLPADGIEATADLTDAVSAARAECLIVNWRHQPDDAHVSGDDAADIFGARLTAAGWQVGIVATDRDFLVHTYARRPEETAS